MRRPRTLLVLLLLSCAAGAAPAAETTKQTAAKSAAADDASLRKIVENHVTRFNAGDWKGIRDQFTADALMMHQFSPDANGPDQIASMFKDDFQHSAASKMKVTVAARVEEAKVIGSWGYTRGLWTYTANMEGKTQTRDVRFLELLQRQPDGEWKIARSIDNTSSWPN